MGTDFMDLGGALTKILNEYPTATTQPFTGNALAAFIRRDFPELIRNTAQIPDEYEIVGSAGQSRWVKSPWAAILDPTITDSAQRGYYFVYLFREDFTGCYLSFNQGVTDVRDIYGASVKAALRTRAIDFRSRPPNIPDQFSASQIDLRPSAQSNYAADYEAGNILAKFYDPSDMPADSILAQDLQSCSSPENGAKCL
jgi:5-methylcytosine-specific restriction enzyme A